MWFWMILVFTEGSGIFFTVMLKSFGGRGGGGFIEI